MKYKISVLTCYLWNSFQHIKMWKIIDFMRWEIWWFYVVYLEGTYLKKTKGKVYLGNNMLYVLSRYGPELPYDQSCMKRPYGFHRSWIYNGSNKKKKKLYISSSNLLYRTVLQADLTLLNFALLHFTDIENFIKEALWRPCIEQVYQGHFSKSICSFHVCVTFW